MPRLKGNRLAVMSASGGSSVILGDMCEQHGFVLPEIDQDLLDQLEQGGRARIIKLTNPLDFGDLWNMDLYIQALNEITALDYIDGVIVVFPIGDPVSATMGNMGKHIVSLMKTISLKVGKPILMSSMGGTIGIKAMMRELDFPIVVDPEDTVPAFEALYRFSIRH